MALHHLKCQCPRGALCMQRSGNGVGEQGLLICHLPVDKCNHGGRWFPTSSLSLSQILAIHHSFLRHPGPNSALQIRVPFWEGKGTALPHGSKSPSPPSLPIRDSSLQSEISTRGKVFTIQGRADSFYYHQLWYLQGSGHRESRFSREKRNQRS